MLHHRGVGAARGGIRFAHRRNSNPCCFLVSLESGCGLFGSERQQSGHAGEREGCIDRVIDSLLAYPQQIGKPAPVVVKMLTHVFRETDFPNDSGPLFTGGCHRLLDDVQHEFRWGLHTAGEPVEMRLIDGFKPLFPAQIERKAVVLDVLNGRHQVVCRG